MLEVRNLKKIYKSKTGADVHALDGVSVQFPEKGMVFLLGKSGSGKSTLLNVCGGLDAPTEGEIIVKGRSSKDFSQSDFDSYRNTFIGFIFQEYNILNEFSVEDNIALALELQGKPKDKAAINALLEEVDLAGYAKRKPNTLSGGQKQRIAIARALVKAPEIIMADEPTGALDSNTGKQVFDTLKKLSRDKLVIVVSHDRDFAEQYADRIIELKDGKILSDVTKTLLEQQPLSENVNTVGGVLCIKKGAALTAQDFDKIKTFLQAAEDDVIIASDEKDVENFKKVSRIGDSGEKEVFCDTDPAAVEKKQYSKEDSRFIRSKLPLRHAVKIGLSGLRNKPVRLFFTVILCTVAFTLFGLLSTLSFYNSEATFKQTLADNPPAVIQTVKNYKATVTWYANGKEESSHETFYGTRFNDADLTSFADLSTDAFGGLRISGSYNTRPADAAYWVNAVNALAVLPEGNALRARITGAYPKNADEILISSYSAQVMQNCKVYDHTGALLELAAPNDIIGKKITVGGRALTVSGVFDSGAVPEKYEPLKQADHPESTLNREFATYLGDELHLLAFVTSDRLAALAKESPSWKESITQYTSAVTALKKGGSFEFPDWGNTSYQRLSDFGANTTVHTIAGKTTPADKEAVLPSALFASLVRDAFYRLADDANAVENHKLAEEYYRLGELASNVESGGAYSTGEKPELIPYTAAELDKKIVELITAAKKHNVSLTLGLKPFDNENQTALGETETFSIIAVYPADNRYGQASVVLTDNDFNRLWDVQKATVDYYATSESVYKPDANAPYDVVYLPYTHSEQAANSCWKMYSDTSLNEDGSRVTLTGNAIGTLQMVDELVKQLSNIFLYVGLVLAVFAALLFSNFISVSISQKKREIGILRAVGARSADVFKIFFSESFFIAAICLLLSTVTSGVVCGFINTALAAEVGASLFIFGVPSFLVLIAIAGVTAVVATFLPVNNAARKKPVDSIRAL